MKRILTGLAAGAAMLGLAVGVPTSAQAFVPAVAAAIAGGAILGGTALGAATTVPYHYGYYGPSYAEVAPAAPTVESVGPACYYTHARIHGLWRRVRVCD